MSSYHSKFTYLNKDSDDDFHLLITHFDADEGETDSYLLQSQVFTESYNGKKRTLYGTKWSQVASVKVTVIKQNRGDFSVTECRNIYKWLTGNPSASWLDLYCDNKLKYCFLCTCQNVQPYKLDARTVGLTIYFESVSPWAYSPQQTFRYNLEQKLSVNNDGVLEMADEDNLLRITPDNVLYNDGGEPFSLIGNDVVGIYAPITFNIDNQSDDLYSYAALNITFFNDTSERLIIKNATLNEETVITAISKNETIQLSENQFITSDITGKIFGNTFNFIWPRLAPGINQFVIDSNGKGTLEFTYRYPIKIGDCAVDVYVNNGSSACKDNTEYGLISWDDIVDTPTTIGGYGITDAYTETEVDTKFNDISAYISIDESGLDEILSDVLG